MILTIMRKLKYILLIIIALIAQNIYSQSGKIVIILKKPPPFLFYTEDMFKLTIINPTQETYRVYLRGISTELIEGLLVEASCNVFTVPPGVKNVKIADIGKVTIDKKNEKYKDVITRMGQLPTGNYDICVDVVDAATGNILGTDCINQEVLLVSQLMLVSPGDNSVIGSPGDDDPSNKPPKLKKPPFQVQYNNPTEDKIHAGSENDGADINFIYESTPDSGKNKWDKSYGNLSSVNSQIVFTWLPPVPVPRGYSVTYKIKIAEIIGMQSAYDAMQSNPLFYSQNNISATSYQYPIAARSFTAGMKYSWQVQAFVNGTLLSESEVWSFRYGQNTASNRQRPPKIKKPPFNYFMQKDNFDLTIASENQKKRNPFMFSFSSKSYGETANRFGTGSDKEPRNGYLELTPSLGVYGIPFSTSILFSSENSGSRQSINSAGMKLDVSLIKEILQERFEKEKEKIVSGNNLDVSKLTQKELQKIESDAKKKVNSRLSPIAKFISDFRSFGVGTTYPSYSPLTIQGIPLTGLNFEYNPGWFYIALAGAKNLKAIENTSFTRQLYSGRIGYGQKDKSHFYFTGMYANDNTGSITVDSSNQLLKPNSNYLFGIEGRLNLFNEKLTIEAEAVGSMLTRDNRDPDLENRSIPGFVKNIFHPKISSQVDYSYSVKTVFNNEKSKTKLSAQVKMIGPGFVTLGNPSLRGDKLEVETRLEQKLANNQVTVRGSLKWFRDNLIKSRSATTTNMIPSLMVNLNFKKMPYVMLSYMPVFMKNDATSSELKFDYKSHLFMLSSGHNVTIGKSYLNQSLSYTFNTASSLDTSSGYTSHGLTLYETFTFEFPLTLSAGFSAQFFDYVNDYSRTLSFDGNINYTFEEIITNTLGIGKSVDKDKNGKIYFYLGTGLNIIKGVTLDIRAEKNLYTDWLNGVNNYDEFILKGTLTTNF